MPFVKIPQESDDEKETREMREMRVCGPDAPIYAIPYEYIGNQSASLYDKGIDPKQYTTNYPDWYKLTPAYDINFSGMTWSERLSTLFNPNSSNNMIQRGVRWVKEDKTVTYCDRKDKIAAIASMLLLLMTFMITTYQLYVDAQIVYVPTNSKNTTQCASLTKWANHWVWVGMKVMFSAIPALIVINNVFKRTTLPKRNTRITSFRSREAIPTENIINADRSKQRITMANIRTKPIPVTPLNISSNKIIPLDASFSLQYGDD